MRRSFCFRALAAVVALVGSACSLPKAPAPEPPAAVADVRAGGNVSVAVSAPAGVDPLNYHEPSALSIGHVLCETLVTVDPATGELKPGALVQKWTLTDSGSRIIFQLRQDAYFHDGRQVRSADIVESLRRLADPGNLSHVASLLSTVRGYNQYREAVENNDLLPSFPGLRVIEPFSFEILTSGAHPDFLRVLTHPALAPVSKAPYDADAASAPAFPQCAGPYRLVSPYRRGDPEVVLRRFDRFNGRSPAFVNGGSSFVDEIRFKFFADPAAAYGAYAQGEIDIAPVPWERVAEAQERFGPRLVTGDIAQAEFIGLSSGEQSPYKDRTIRRALSQAIDRQALVAPVYKGSRRPAGGFVPPPVATDVRSRGQNDRRGVEFGCGSTVPVAGDAEAARRSWADAKESVASRTEAELLEQAGLQLVFNDEAPHRAMAEAVAARWKEVLGLNVTLQPQPWTVYEAQMRTSSNPFRISYSAPYPSVEAFFEPLFGTGPRAIANMTGYRSSVFAEGLYGNLRPRTDDAERMVAARDLEELLCRDLPLIPIAFGQVHFVMSEKLAPARHDGALFSRDGTLLLREFAVRG